MSDGAYDRGICTVCNAAESCGCILPCRWCGADLKETDQRWICPNPKCRGDISKDPTACVAPASKGDGGE